MPYGTGKFKNTMKKEARQQKRADRKELVKNVGRKDAREITKLKKKAAKSMKKNTTASSKLKARAVNRRRA
jgi:hypothetical protein